LFSVHFTFAQNTGAGPYLNSWHTYRVVVGSALNTREWEIINHDTTIVRALDSSMAWVDIAALSGSNADISICFTDSVFNLTETWYLRYREISVVTLSCVAARRFTINLTENNFYLTLDANDTLCKPEDGQVFRWEQLFNVRYECSFSFLVTMHKEATFTINNWAFDGTLTFDFLNHIIVGYTATVVTPNGGTIDALIDVGGGYGIANDGIFRVEVSDPVTPTLTEVTVQITLTLSGYVYDGIEATLTLTNGIINSGTSGLTITNDNLLRPYEGPPDNVADPALRDRLQTVVFNGLPATPNIAIND
jgi:hypothetical protein